MNIDYTALAKTNIFNTEIQVKGNKENVLYHKYKPEVVLNVTDYGLELYALNVLTNTKKKYPFAVMDFASIEELSVSICRRNYGNISAIIMNEYHIDLTMKTFNGKSFELESQSWKNFIQMMDIIYQKDVKVKDPFNVYDNYRKYQEKYIEELDKTFDKLADQYNIPHYRAGNKR